eukprot:scaffold13742_cov157-Amphora_coffeaeformis.AAC.5
MLQHKRWGRLSRRQLQSAVEIHVTSSYLTMLLLVPIMLFSSALETRPFGAACQSIPDLAHSFSSRSVSIGTTILPSRYLLHQRCVKEDVDEFGLPLW